ncbi:MAG: hypothetical protein HQ564_08825 [Candidatus Saganbacteria bacterium]|nr:hypothetical protein [Candidatus Saganbacteria bacterium]
MPITNSIRLTLRAFSWKGIKGSYHNAKRALNGKISEKEMQVYRNEEEYLREMLDIPDKIASPTIKPLRLKEACLSNFFRLFGMSAVFSGSAEFALIAGQLSWFILIPPLTLISSISAWGLKRVVYDLNLEKMEAACYFRNKQEITMGVFIEEDDKEIMFAHEFCHYLEETGYHRRSVSTIVDTLRSQELGMLDLLSVDIKKNKDNFDQLAKNAFSDLSLNNKIYFQTDVNAGNESYNDRLYEMLLAAEMYQAAVKAGDPQFVWDIVRRYSLGQNI